MANLEKYSKIATKLKPELVGLVGDLTNYENSDKEVKVAVIVANSETDYSNKINTKILQDFTRLTIVDETGLVYEVYNKQIIASVQDNYKTLKLFISDLPKKKED